MRPDGAPGQSDADAEAEGWLRQLRDGSPPQKAEARWRLADIFARRGLTEQAVELLVANARAGYRSPELFETLARHYRTLGNEYLAASATLEAARLRERGGPATSPTGGSGNAPRAHPGADRRSGPSQAQAGAGRAYQSYTHPPPPAGGPGQRAGAYGAGVPGGVPPGDAMSWAQWERPLRIAGWVACVGLFLAAMAVGQRSPFSAVIYMMAAAMLGLLLTGAPGLRRLLRIPTGPLGDGLLLFVGVLLFLAGGALLPRDAAPFASPAAPASGPTPRIPPTPTDPPLVPTARPGVAPTASPAVSPSPVAQMLRPEAVQSAVSAGASPPPPAGFSTQAATGSASPSPPTAVSGGAVESMSDLPAGAALQVVGAGSEGVRLRTEPGGETVLHVLADGERLEAMGQRQQDGGRQWQRVRLPDGREGWIAADFLMVMAATPVVAAAASRTPAATRATLPAAPAAPTSAPPSTAPTTALTLTTTALAPAPTRAATAMTAVAAATQQPSAPISVQTPTSAPAPSSAPRAQAPRGAPLGMDCPAGLPIKGNHSSSGEWIYHRPGGQFYGRTRPEECFATEADARAAGYRASQR